MEKMCPTLEGVLLLEGLVPLSCIIFQMEFGCYDPHAFRDLIELKVTGAIV